MKKIIITGLAIVGGGYIVTQIINSAIKFGYKTAIKNIQKILKDPKFRKELLEVINKNICELSTDDFEEIISEIREMYQIKKG